MNLNIEENNKKINKVDNFNKNVQLYELNELAKFSNLLAFYHCVWQEYKNGLDIVDVKTFSYRKNIK